MADDQLHMIAYVRCDFPLHGLDSMHQLLEATGGATVKLVSYSRSLRTRVLFLPDALSEYDVK